MKLRGRIRLGIGGAVATALAAALLLPLQAADAQEAVDARWLPWLGCWSEVGTSGEALCVRPAADAEGVELVTLRDGEIAESRTLRADGVARGTTRQGCSGTEGADFSSDGHRLYLRSDFTCEGELDRRGTGLIAWVTPSEWVRVESVDVAGERASVTERYGVAPEAAAEGTGLEDVLAGREMAVRSARQAASSSPSVDDLVETDGRVDAEALRAWVAELEEPLAVNAEKLARLADAGVADEVIDVVVAVSFPEHFAVDRDARGRNFGGAAPAYRGRLGSPFHGRGYYYPDPFHFGYTPFGYGYSRHGWWYGAHRPTVVIVSPRDDADGGGRVVSERGYTRGGGPAQDPASAGRIDLPSRGSVTPSGASSGRSSGSTGRKAKPRDSSSGDGGSSDGGA